jgi:hypothetical protein
MRMFYIDKPPVETTEVSMIETYYEELKIIPTQKSQHLEVRKFL